MNAIHLAPGARRPTALITAALIGGALAMMLPAAADAQTPAAKPAAKPAAQASAKAPVRTARAPARKSAAPEPVIAAADPAQIEAAKEVMLGRSGCEFNQSINLGENARHPGYVDLSFNNRTYLMKPVLSATGALRLEDVRAETLLIQIGTKTMLMNQKTGQRLVDNCIHARQSQIAASGVSGQALGVEPPKK
ncbi:MAG: hypothetical protein AB7G13_30045 [Lautropia sp.]